MRALAVVLALALPGSAWAECPQYSKARPWQAGTQVGVNLSFVSPEFRDAAEMAFALWNDANRQNGSGVHFFLGDPGVWSPVTVKVGTLPPTNGAYTGGETAKIVDDKPPHDLAAAYITINTDEFGMLARPQFFTKVLMHEIGHTMGLADVYNCGNSGATLMNQICADPRENDTKRHSFPTDAMQPCDVGAVKNDPRRKPPPPPPPVSKYPDPGCLPRNGVHLCDEKDACVWVDNEPKHCELSIVCEPIDVTRKSCSGQLAQVSVSGDPCGSWKHMGNDAERPGDYACADTTDPFTAPSCAQLGLQGDPPTCDGKPVVHTEVAAIGLLCHSCAYVPPPPPPPDPGPCVPQGCPDVVVNGCKWKPNGCGGEILCGVCLPPPPPPLDDPPGGGGDKPPPDDPPVCTSTDHNEQCFGSFKACSEVCCGVCESKKSCGGASAHKCFEP